MLLYILQCTENPCNKKIAWPKMSIAPRLRNTGPNIIHFYHSNSEGASLQGYPTGSTPETDMKLLNLSNTGLFFL